MSWIWGGAGVAALGAYGVVATPQEDANFGRIDASHGGVVVAGSLAWGMAMDAFKPDRYDVIGALVCLAAVASVGEGAVEAVTDRWSKSQPAFNARLGPRGCS